MLTFKLDGDILEVHEQLHSWTNTRQRWWYYDIKNWLQSSHGRQNETPLYPMDESSIQWVKTHHLPKVLP
jgi:hypothetical protein